MRRSSGMPWAAAVVGAGVVGAGVVEMKLASSEL